MELNTSLSGTGRPQVRFQFDDLGVFTTFDVLTFPWAQRVAGVVGMTVNDHLWSGTACTRCYGDLEWVVGGPGNGYQTTLTGSSSIVLFLDWFNGHNLQAVPSSVDYGISTAEGINGVQAQTVWDPAGVPGVALSVANGSLGPLWTEGQLSILEVSVRTGIPSGDLSLNGTDVPFVGSFVELLVAPGTISGSVTSGSSTFPLGTLTLTQGEALTLEVGALAAVFAPSGLPEGTVWSVTVGSQTLVGTGNLTFGESPGTYPFLVGTVPGYSASPASGNISVNSSGSLVEVQWKPTHAGLLAMLGELLHSWWEVALAIIVILGALGVAWAISSRGPVHPSARRSSLAPLPPRWLTVCPHCGRSVRAGARSCPECGTRLEPPGHGPSPPP
jgi:thermopsin